MTSKESSLRIYQELADRHDRRREARQRDIFLVLAAEAALALGQPEQAELIRRRLLALSPHHLLKPYSSMAEALRSPDLQFYIEDLKRLFPPEQAEHLLRGKEESKLPPSSAEPHWFEVQQPAATDRSAGKTRPSVSVAPAGKPSMPARFAAPLTTHHEPLTSSEAADEETAGSWLAWLLFGVLLALALVLAGYTLVPIFTM